MPMFGLGTWRIKGEIAYSTVRAAIKLGYRLIDSASVYGNEDQVGRAIRDAVASGDVERDDVWVTTKINTRDQGFEKASNSIAQSLEIMGLDYIDCILVHFPATRGLDHKSSKNLENRKGTWSALEEAVRAGKLRSIGVSNYTVRHLREMIEGSEGYANVKPVINQFELHPCLYDKELVQYCQSNGIHVQAYSSFAEGRFFSEPKIIGGSDFPQEPVAVVGEIAKKYGTDAGTVLLAWALAHNILVIPKSVNESRLRSNLQAIKLQLDPEDVGAIDQLSSKPCNVYRGCWDPSNVV